MRCTKKLRTIKTKFVVLFAALITLCLYISSKNMLFLAKNKNMAKLPYVVVHFDLKGTPLKMSYLKKLLPLLKDQGANGLLMEYEDMFPYEGKLVNLSAENCFKKRELREFLRQAKKNRLEIIPLVQTFGHMEHVLKLAEFQHLREESQYPDSICPSKSDKMILLKDMIGQITRFHNVIAHLKFIHVGCDEVFHLNKCQQCVKKNMSNSDLFLSHVKEITKVVKSLSSRTTVLIWDDMLRGIRPDKWDRIEKFNNVQLVCWDYEPTIKVSHANLYKYHQKFPNLWIASAFKGADGRIATFPNTRYRFLNLFQWLNFINGYIFAGEKEVHGFKGIILTGWSRYSHMDPPCELLPVAFPSLIINLLLIKEYQTGIISAKWTTEDWDIFYEFVSEYLPKSILQCEGFDNVFDEAKCNFEGRKLYIELTKYSDIISKISDNTRLDNDELGLESFEYYSKIGFVNTNKVPNYLTSMASNLKGLMELEKSITREMDKFYERDFVTEYVNYKSYFVRNRLKSVMNSLNQSLDVRTWPRRRRNSSYFL